jgi:hypothetical protein
MPQPEQINPECFACHLPDCNPDHPNCPLQMETVKLRMKKSDVKTLKQYLLLKTGQRLDAGIVELLEVVAERINRRKEKQA